ncbi:hypothetical protein CERZMDRAFT_87866 [Cercospora zeae-maydis SCOH1-5]|uniref:Uncharacterized protein n=1 Tax=Cercospora zeae-maydis SCOH1-5 TaxID=717836 RepID=A0A6A6F3I7_9PEZI|nr:hypothetical protein CERZMDRAFT_87866 [Cercospora zeae-maydis SCOH1-5]
MGTQSGPMAYKKVTCLFDEDELTTRKRRGALHTSCDGDDELDRSNRKLTAQALQASTTTRRTRDVYECSQPEEVDFESRKMTPNVLALVPSDNSGALSDTFLNSGASIALVVR